MDIVYKLFMWWKLSFLLGLCLGVELPGHVVTLGLPQGWGSLVGCRLLLHRVGHDWSDLAAAAAAAGGSVGKELACNAGEARDMEKGMATHSSILAWKIPLTEGLAGYSP